MKKTVSVSIDERLLEIAKGKAWEAKMSLSKYFETKLTTGWDASEVGKPVRRVARVKVVEPRSMSDPSVIAEYDELEAAQPATREDSARLEAEELKQANERLLKKRTEIKGAIKTASELPDRYKSPEFSGGVPKAKWKGAK